MKDQMALLLKSLFIFNTLLLFTAAKATNYYFSSSAGDDNRSATEARHPATPWRSLQKLQQQFSALLPGDSVLFKRNDIFFGYLQVTASGSAAAPVVLSAYGTGKEPVISGFTTLTNWTAVGNGTWEALVPEAPDRVRSVLVNGAPEALGRYPNASAPNGGYLGIEEVPAANAITGPSLPAGDWMGADVVIRKNHWVLDRNKVTGVSGKTIQYLSESGYGASKNYGYFMQNHPATLDHACEWYYHAPTHRVGMWLGQSTAGFVVEASTIERLLTINGKSYITIDGLVFKGANLYAVDIDHADHIQLKNGGIFYSGNTAVHATASQFIGVENFTIDHTNNIACDISNTSQLVLKNNTVSNTGAIAGSGSGDSGSYEAFLLSGDHQVIEGNTITNTGYIPLTFNGNDILVRNNVISRFGFVKDDGGGIYTWNNTANAPAHNNRTIDANIVLEGLGAPQGTEDRKAFVHGIYIDDNADHVNISNNTIAHCAQYGIYLHNAHGLVLDSNTAFNNGAQVALIHDNIAPDKPIRNISFTHNISFSRTAVQPVALFKSIGDDLADMGQLDNNYYCRPLNEQAPIEASWKSGWGIYDLEGWQQLSGKDLHSRKTPVAIAPYSVRDIISANKYGNGLFNNNINNLYAFAAGDNAAVSWSNTSPLDAGALRLSFSKLSGNREHASVIIGIGEVKQGHQYLLKYEVAGAANRYIEAYLRQSLAPYHDLSERKQSRVYNIRTSAEVHFTAHADESNASLGLDIEEQNDPLYIDNLQLYEVQADITNPDDSIRFVYNTTNTVMSWPLDGVYIDVKEKGYTGAISLLPFHSAVLIKKALVTLPVIFSSFKAIKQETTVQLQWTLSDDHPGTVQYIERSTDGQQFMTIGKVAALTAAGTGSFSYTDEAPRADNYYRVRYATENGTGSYSKTARVLFPERPELPAGKQMQIIPNPATNTIQVIVDKNIFRPGTLVLETVTGVKIRSIRMEQASITVDVASLAAGTYVISLRINNKKISSRFVKR